MRFPRGALGSVLVDVVAVAVFVILGRDAHHHADGLAGIASTSWPFLAGLAAGWVAVGLAWAGGVRLGMLGVGLVIWPVTVGLGMVLRVVAGQGTAVAFVFVALIFLGAFFLGWRLVVLALRARRLPGRRVAGNPPSAAQAGAGVEMPTPPRVADP